MLCRNSIHYRSFLLDSLLVYFFAQVPSSAALPTFFQTTFRAQNNNYPLLVKGEVITDTNNSRVNFKRFDNLSEMEIWDQPTRVPFVNDLNSCSQVRLPFLGESSVSPLLIGDCLFSGISLDHAQSELNANAIIWLDIPILKLSGSSKRIVPLFRVTRVSSNDNQLMIKAQPLNCDQCPYRPKNSNSDSKCCGGCEHNSKAIISAVELYALSTKETQDDFFEPVEINYQFSSNELNIGLKTTQGTFITKLSQHPKDVSFSEGRHSSVMPLALLLSAATLVRSKPRE